MRRIGFLGLLVGSLLGLLLALVFLFLLARQAASSVGVQAAAPTSDVALFLSARSLSRLASEEMARPLVLVFKPGGRVEITTRVEIGGLEPVVHLGLLLEMQGTQVVSRLQWLKFGFVALPAAWLPPEVVELGARPGQTISAQMPPDFTLAGLETTPDGIELRLNWIGESR